MPELIGGKDLRWWTNFGLLVSIVIALVVMGCHGYGITAAVTAFGAALGVGGVLGFLFGVPTHTSNSPVNIKSTGTGPITVSTGNDSPAEGSNSGAGVAAKPGGSDTPGGTGDTPPHDNSISNLEQVADWITKLLLGGGLTQMQHIPPKIWQWSRVVAIGILGERQTTEQLIEAQQAYAAGVMVYGFVLGFFAGFLITKLQLGKAIQD